MRHLVRRPIDPGTLLAEVSGPERGAVTLFLGTVRNENAGRSATGIDYSAYEPMAERELGRIVRELEARHPGLRVALEHRVGELAVGETSLGIAMAHPHSAPALDALGAALRAVKQRVPIWKREHYVDGTRAWVAVGDTLESRPVAVGGRADD